VSGEYGLLVPEAFDKPCDAIGEPYDVVGDIGLVGTPVPGKVGCNDMKTGFS
jgi:hypothetical protein